MHSQFEALSDYVRRVLVVNFSFLFFLTKKYRQSNPHLSFLSRDGCDWNGAGFRWKKADACGSTTRPGSQKRRHCFARTHCTRFLPWCERFLHSQLVQVVHRRRNASAYNRRWRSSSTPTAGCRSRSGMTSVRLDHRALRSPCCSVNSSANTIKECANWHDGKWTNSSHTLKNPLKTLLK